MRAFAIAAAIIALLALPACNALDRLVEVDACSDFYRYSSGGLSEERVKAACTCAIDREQAGPTPIASVPPRANPELPAYRRHLPDCFAANGGTATGVAARESSGQRPRPSTFDPATGRWTDPEDQVMPGPGESDEEAPPPPEEPPPSTRDGPPSVVVPGSGFVPAAPGAAATRPGAARPRVPLASYLSDADYPAVAARNNEEGRVAFTLDISPEGRVTNCVVTRSSGSAALDSATCRIMRSRARYSPARNARGQAIAGRDEGAVTWQLAD